MKNLSKALAAIIISTAIASPALAETKGKPGYYGVDQKNRTFFVTNFPPDSAQKTDSDAAKLCFTKDGDTDHFSKYNCGYYHVSAAVLEKMGIDPNAPAPPDQRFVSADGASPIGDLPPYQNSNRDWCIRAAEKPTNQGAYEPGTGSCKEGYLSWHEKSQRQEPFYNPVPPAGYPEPAPVIVDNRPCAVTYAIYNRCPEVLTPVYTEVYTVRSPESYFWHYLGRGLGYGYGYGRGFAEQCHDRPRCTGR